MKWAEKEPELLGLAVALLIVALLIVGCFFLVLIWVIS